MNRSILFFTLFLTTGIQAATQLSPEQLANDKKLFEESVTATRVEDVNSEPPVLTSIVPWNKELVWKDKEKSYVLMVSWMGEKPMKMYYQNNVGKELTTSTDLRYLSWATAVPEIKHFSQEYTSSPNQPTPLAERLNQKLGLEPNLSQKYFVQMWVKPSDLSRPCLNHEVLGKYCLYDPESTALPESFRDIRKFVTIDPVHYRWFTGLKQKSYSGDHPQPWTRLGYTYDWGDQKDHFGFTEFIIKPGSKVIIESITSTDDYPNTPLPQTSA